MYNIYSCMKQRCYNPKNKDYKHYGARNIKSEWKYFEQFLKDMKKGYHYKLTLDRIDNSKGYSKKNCRWIPLKDQSRNRRPFNQWNLTSPYWKRNRNDKLRRTKQEA